MSYVISAYLIFYVSIFIFSARTVLRCNILEKKLKENKRIDGISE